MFYTFSILGLTAKLVCLFWRRNRYVFISSSLTLVRELVSRGCIMMYAKSVLQFPGGTVTNTVYQLLGVYTQPLQMRNVCYDLLPVQYTELTHQLRKFLLYNWVEKGAPGLFPTFPGKKWKIPTHQRSQYFCVSQQHFSRELMLCSLPIVSDMVATWEFLRGGGVLCKLFSKLWSVNPREGEGGAKTCRPP